MAICQCERKRENTMCHWQFGSQVQKLTFQVCRAAGVIPHGCTKHIRVKLETRGCISTVLFWYVRVNSDHYLPTTSMFEIIDQWQHQKHQTLGLISTLVTAKNNIVSCNVQHAKLCYAEDPFYHTDAFFFGKCQKFKFHISKFTNAHT